MMAGVPSGGLFARLRAAAEDEWRAYVGHPFVRQLAAGTLPESCFRRYLVQDYLFLIQFARAYGLAAYKSEEIADIRAAAAGLTAIIETEIGLHIDFCKGWGLGEDDLANAPEAPETTAYTRYVLDRGMAGDLLDLHVALAPCIIGYAEIGAAIIAEHGTPSDDHPYGAWISMYAGGEYQEVARDEAATLDSLFTRYGAERRVASLERTFVQATRLEADFWQMGLTPDPWSAA